MKIIKNVEYMLSMITVVIRKKYHDLSTYSNRTWLAKKLNILNLLNFGKILQFFNERIGKDMMSLDIIEFNEDIIRDVEQAHI